MRYYFLTILHKNKYEKSIIYLFNLNSKHRLIQLIIKSLHLPHLVSWFFNEFVTIRENSSIAIK